MKVKNKVLFRKIRKVFSSIKSSDSVCIISDYDADGLSSAKLIAKVLENSNVKPKFLATDISREFFSAETINKIEEHKIKWVITADFSITGLKLNDKYHDLLSKGINFIIFDHHEFSPELNRKSSLYIHPNNLFGIEKADSASFSTSMLVYETFADLLKNYSWVEALGMLGDMSFLKYRKKAIKILEKYEGKNLILKSNKDYYKTKLGQIANLIAASASLKDKKAFDRVINIFFNSKSGDQIESKLSKINGIKKIFNAISYYEKNFNKVSTFTRDITFLEIKSRYKIGSFVVNIISSDKNKTYVVYEKYNGFYKVSLRRQDNQYNLADLVKKSISSLKDATGGGHIPSAGVKVRAADIGRFKKNLLLNYEKFKIR